ncbi:MAG: hypothetical protein IKB50_03465 [Clostridia bacterium]|nr:hypothetical protein [Clostridia bacterium]
MGIKGKMAKFMISKIADKVTNSNKTDEIANIVINKLYELDNKTTKHIRIEDTKENYLIVRGASISVNDALKMVTDKYDETIMNPTERLVYDKNNTLKYRSQETTSSLSGLSRDTISIYDAKNQKIGEINVHSELMEGVKNIFSLDFKKDLKKCTVKLGSEELCILEKYESDGNIIIKSKNGDIGITPIHKKGFEIFHDKNLVAKMYPSDFKFSHEYTDKFTIQYDDLEKEKIAVLITIAIDTII